MFFISYVRELIFEFCTLNQHQCAKDIFRYRKLSETIGTLQSDFINRDTETRLKRSRLPFSVCYLCSELSRVLPETTTTFSPKQHYTLSNWPDSKEFQWFFFWIWVFIFSLLVFSLHRIEFLFHFHYIYETKVRLVFCAKFLRKQNNNQQVVATFFHRDLSAILNFCFLCPSVSSVPGRFCAKGKYTISGIFEETKSSSFASAPQSRPHSKSKTAEKEFHSESED